MMWIANIEIALENANYFNCFNKIRQYFFAPDRLGGREMAPDRLGCFKRHLTGGGVTIHDKIKAL
jgi:hypothetical protein